MCLSKCFGTFLSNDMGEFIREDGVVYKPLSIVMKLMICDGLPVAKISDEPAKTMSRSDAYVSYLMEIHNVKVPEAA